MYRESLRAQPGQEESTTSTGRRQPGRRGFSPVCSRYSGFYCQDVSVRSFSLLGILSLPGYFARCPIRRDHLSVCGLTGAGPTGVWHHQVLPLCCLPPTNLSRSGRPIQLSSSAFGLRSPRCKASPRLTSNASPTAYPLCLMTAHLSQDGASWQKCGRRCSPVVLTATCTKFDVLEMYEKLDGNVSHTAKCLCVPRSCVQDWVKHQHR